MRSGTAEMRSRMSNKYEVAVVNRPVVIIEADTYSILPERDIVVFSNSTAFNWRFVESIIELPGGDA